MAKKQTGFPEFNTALVGEARRHRTLFLSKYLRQYSDDNRLRNDAQKTAHEIICRWADLETEGKLEKKKETTLQGEFMSDVFGRALGYTRFSANLKQWNLEEQFSVNGQTADSAIGLFEHGKKNPPAALIELKGPTVNLDRDRFNGRTPVQQCWDYLNSSPQCPWGIVSNYVSFRLYHRDHTPRAYEIFTLQDLRRDRIFEQFYYLFERGGLLPVTLGQIPRAIRLLEETTNRQRVVGDELYKNYHRNRILLIEHLQKRPHDKSLDTAITVTQKLLDRIIFIAFCEDRGLLPQDSIAQAYANLPPFYRVTNPRWQNFLNLFRSIDKGNLPSDIAPYNGGLFRDDPAVDNLELGDNWTDFFKEIGSYNFYDEVNVDILGHLFERSVNDLERIRLGGLFEPEKEIDDTPKMKKSAERKRFGIFYTPPDFTAFIVKNTVANVAEQRFTDVARKRKMPLDELGAASADPKRAELWRLCLDQLRQIKIIDPACGSGAFLIQAYDLLENIYQEVIDHIVYHDGDHAELLYDRIPDFILHDNLFGVDLSPEAVEITQLALWLRSATKGKSLADLSHNILCGNSLVNDPDIHPRALNFQQSFPDIFSRPNSGFDCVIGNPPWERLKLQEREFFDTVAPEIASAVSAAQRRKKIDQLEKTQPELYQRYLDAKANAENTLDHVRTCGRFPLTAKGDINTYAAFAELAHNLIAPKGRAGILVPSGIATDHTTRNFFGKLTADQVLIGLYDFENKAPIFPDVHRSFKFCALLYGGSDTKAKAADFVFFAREMEELDDKNRHIELSPDDFKLLNPNTRTCPIFRSRRDAELTKQIYRRVPVLIDKSRKQGGNPWGIKFLRMFDQTNDAELFHTAEQLQKSKYKRSGPLWKKAKQTYLPLYEAKMIQMFDHRAAGVVIDESNWMRQGQTDSTVLVQHQNPEFSPEPRWWVDEKEVTNTLKSKHDFFIGFKDITSPTNQRTIIAAAIPWSAVTNHFPLILNEVSPRTAICLLANLNSFVLDFVARQKIGGVTLNFFIMEQLPIYPPDFYQDRCPWNSRQTLEKWISDRVLKLSCTSNDMIPLADAAGFKARVHKFKPAERADLMAQLDAAFFLLYGIKKSDLKYILSTFAAAGKLQDNLFAPASPADRILQHYDQLQAKS
jgi:Eco57I restriction-modification methylase